MRSNNSYEKSGHATGVNLVEISMEMFDSGVWQRQHYYSFIFFMKNFDVSNLEGGIDPSYSKVSQDVEATNSDEEGIKLKEIKNAGTVDEVDVGLDAPELNEVPNGIATLVENLFKIEAEGAQGKEDVYSVLWDFGGQSVYYATHPLFLTPRAIYLLVNS